MVNQMMCDASLRAKVQQTVPCSQAASRQRGGHAGRDTPGMCLRLVTQLEWNNMPVRDPPQPHMDDQTALYLRLAFTEADSGIRESLLDTLGMTKDLSADAQQMLFVPDLVDTYGHLTPKGIFLTSLDCEPENGCLLWTAHELRVLSEAIAIFAVMSRASAFCVHRIQKDATASRRGPTYYSRCMEYLYVDSTVDQATRQRRRLKVWGKYNLSQRPFEVLCEYCSLIVDKCVKQPFSVLSKHVSQYGMLMDAIH